MNLYDFVNSIMAGERKSKMEGSENDQLAEKTYNPFMTNRTLSYHLDCIMYAQDMNISTTLDSKLQYDYLRYSIRARKRPRISWAKKIKNEDLDLIKKHFNYNNHKATTALSILTQEEIQQIRELYGGMK